jgi:hypothetical protein
MRILDTFDKGATKVTVMTMNNRISIKFEKDMMEVTHKFLDGSPVKDATTAQKYCTDELISSLDNYFMLMDRQRSSVVNDMVANDDFQFEELI